MVGMQGHYFTSFKVPDTYGVYKFVVSYHRPGYTALDVVKRVSSPSMLASSLLYCKCVSSESCCLSVLFTVACLCAPAACRCDAACGPER